MAAAGKSESSYSMTKPRLGVAIIIDNISTNASEVDVAALKQAYETAGCEVHVYSNCDLKKYENIKTWVCAEETHKFCNMFSLVMMSRITNGDKLLDYNGKELMSINELVKDITDIFTLNEKPKLITVQAYVDIDNPIKTYQVLKFPELPERKDVFIAYSQIGRNSSGREDNDSGPRYLQEFSKALETEFKNKSVQEIFGMAKAVIKQRMSLTDSMLMNLAEHVSESDMKTLAIGSFEIKKPKVDNLHSNKKSAEDFNFQVMVLWRNKSAENTKEKLSDILADSSAVDNNQVEQCLKINSKEQHMVSIENDGLGKELHLSEFHKVERLKIVDLEGQIKQLKEQNVGSEEYFTKTRQSLDEEIKQLKISEKEKAEVAEKLKKEKSEIEHKITDCQSEIKKLKVEKEVASKKLEQLTERHEMDKKEHQEEIQKMKLEQERLTEKMIREMQESHEKDIETLKEQRERELAELREVEAESLRNLEEQAKISAKRMKRLKGDHLINNTENEKLVQNVTQAKQEAEIESNKAKIIQYQKEIQNLEKAMDEAREEERKKNEELEKQIESKEAEMDRITAMFRRLTTENNKLKKDKY